MAFFTWYGFLTVDVQMASGKSLSKDSLEVDFRFLRFDSLRTSATLLSLRRASKALSTGPPNPNYEGGSDWIHLL